MSDRLLRDEAMTLYLAGHETTAQTLTWTWYLLSQHRHVEEKLVSEWQNTLAGKAPIARNLDPTVNDRLAWPNSLAAKDPGEVGYVLCLAASRDQAQLVFSYFTRSVTWSSAKTVGDMWSSGTSGPMLDLLRPTTASRCVVATPSELLRGIQP